MKRIVVYAATVLIEAAWIAIWIFALSKFRHDPLVFFEVLILGAASAGTIIWQAMCYAEKPREYGRLTSRIEEWERLQTIMRDEERQRRRHSA